MQSTVAHTAPADLTPLTDDALAALLAAVGDDETQVTRVLAELDRRDHADAPPPMTAEQWKRQELNDYRLPGESIVAAADRMYGELTYARYMAAEDACRGVLITVEAHSDGRQIDSYSLFHGNAARAYKWASDELLRWWAEHGRISWAEHMYEWTGYGRYAVDAAKARAAWQAAVSKGRPVRHVGELREDQKAKRVNVRKFGARD